MEQKRQHTHTFTHTRTKKAVTLKFTKLSVTCSNVYLHRRLPILFTDIINSYGVWILVNNCYNLWLGETGFCWSYLWICIISNEQPPIYFQYEL